MLWKFSEREKNLYRATINKKSSVNKIMKEDTKGEIRKTGAVQRTRKNAEDKEKEQTPRCVIC